MGLPNASDKFSGRILPDLIKGPAILWPRAKALY